ncbi:hypothetical protein N9X89_02810 [Luminiphilus sp.]|nr:hypothetical protein [Luminiphilus sp.]
MSRNTERYLKYIRGMSLIETAFASAALSVVVVTGLTVASDTIKSRAKGDARVAMLSENVASIEKARHDRYADGDNFNITAANDEAGRTVARQRLLDADKDKLSKLKATYEQDGAKLYIKTSGDYAILDGANKIALKTAFAGKNEALSIFMGTPDDSVPECTTSIFSGSGSGKGKGKGKSTSWTSKGKKAELKIKGTNMACPTSGAFTASVSTSFCTFGFSKSGKSPNAKCKDDEIFENTTAVVTLDPTDQYCTGDGTASSGMCSVSFNLTAADYQQTFYIQLTDDPSKCTFAPTWDKPSGASKMGVSSKGCK